MNRVSIFSLFKHPVFLLSALLFVIAGCSLEKKSGFNRNLQNLTAHYNILFNAKELLRLKQESYATTFVDNYNELLNVYPDTIAQSSTPDKDLDAVTLKANTIINVKEQSHYIGDAYLLLGKANYLGGNYFNAVEYFSYVIRSFPLQPDLAEEALAWKARSLMYLNQLPQAKLVLDTALQNINPKKSITADVYAVKLQYDVNAQDYKDGEEMAVKALKYCNDKNYRLRWTFILAQLQELNHKPAEAVTNYTKIAKSNASFEFAFNASLNRIRIEETQNGIKISRTNRLLSLLKDPNNKEFQDQIYYQVAEIKRADKDYDGAIKNYKLSVRYSLRNQNQKGLSYLRLAELYFQKKADYLNAKKYYDSTLFSLPPNYPGYQAIQKKGANLQLLADRLQIITREDTLQALAKMDEKPRLALIDKMVSDRILQQQAAASNAAANTYNNDAGPVSSAGGNSSFYFYNTNASSQGLIDFKRVWGNRKLEDNWRRSSRSNSDITNNTANAIQAADPDASASIAADGKPNLTAGNYRKELLTGLPLTPALLAQSNLKIYNAYMDLGNFYRDILGDKKEAIATFELMLRRFPDDTNKPAIYYTLYRLYSDIDLAKSDYYKNILLRDYASTNFAKVIADPEYAKKLDDQDAEFTQAYNQVFDLYSRRQYPQVISSVPEVMKKYPGNKYSAQLYYLQAIAAGHNETVLPFRDSLKQIINKFPNDRLIAPLITQQLTYINTNQAELQTRSAVITDDDPQDAQFTLTPELKQKSAFRYPVRQGYDPVPETKVAEKKKQVAVVKPPDPVIIAAPSTPVTTVPVAAVPAVKPAVADPDLASNLFSESDTTNYLFVINVNSGTAGLSSSRFGVGQFNRANYAGTGIKHQLRAVGAENQLIYVGRFLTLRGVKRYASGIIPLLPEIMKVPKDKFSYFIITQENLDKLADKKTLDSYVQYYQHNY